MTEPQVQASLAKLTEMHSTWILIGEFGSSTDQSLIQLTMLV